MTENVLRRGDLAGDGWDLTLTAERAGWEFSALRVGTLPPGGTIEVLTGTDEAIVVPLEGSFSVEADGTRYALEGRESPFSGPTDVLYLPRSSRAIVTSADGGRFALPAARADRTFPVQFVRAADVPVFVRGAGAWSREVRDFGGAATLQADRLIAVEVVNPGGTWSGIPRHKHDVASATEVELEEVYYFEVAPTPGGPGYALMRVSSSEAGEIEVAAEVRSGDVVLVPFGWHGPVAAPPATDVYYLNVMAGPGGREWRFTDHPDDRWVRAAWAEMERDPQPSAG